MLLKRSPAPQVTDVQPPELVRLDQHYSVELYAELSGVSGDNVASRTTRGSLQ